MLAEWIGSDFAPIRPSRKFHRQPGNVEFADRLVLDPPDRPALAQMRFWTGLFVPAKTPRERNRAAHIDD